MALRGAQRYRCLALAWLLFAVLTTVSAHAADSDAQPEVNPELRKALMAAVSQSKDFPHRFAAEVWLKDMSTRLAPQVADIERRLKLLRLVHAEATRADLSPNLVLAVIQVESSFNRYAISSAGARGLMQVMPFWKDEIGQPDDNMFHIQTNLRYGCTILKFYLQREHGNITRALARYNGSLGQTWYPARVRRALNRYWYKR